MPSRHSARAAALALASALLAFASPAHADWPTDPAVGVLVSGTTANEQDVHVVSDGAAGMIVAWSDNRSVVERTRLQRVSAFGERLWPQAGVTVASQVVQQDMPRIVGDGAGGVFVAWRDARTAPHTRVYAQHFGQNGQFQWAPDGVLAAADTLDMEPYGLVPDGAGGVLIVMIGRVPAAPSLPLYVQRVASDGSLPWGSAPLSLSTAGTNYLSMPMLSADGAGGALIAWNAWDGVRHDVIAQHVTAAGTLPWGAIGARVAPLGPSRFSPSIVSDGAGGAIVEWHDMGVFHVLAQRLDAAGAPLWNPNGVVLWSITETAGDTLVADGSGGAYAMHGRSTTTVRRLLPDGRLAWNGDSLLVTPSFGPSRPAMALSAAPGPTGDLLLAWTQPTTFPLYVPQEIRAQRVTPAGELAWGDSGLVLSRGPDERGGTAIVSDQRGGLLAAWRDRRIANDVDLYAQHVAFDGEFPVAGTPPPLRPRFALSAPAPNPARAGTGATLNARLDLRERVRAAVLDVSGRVVRVLVDGGLSFDAGPAGPVRDVALRWDGRGSNGALVAPGLYFVRVVNGAHAATARVAIVE